MPENKALQKEVGIYKGKSEQLEKSLNAVNADNATNALQYEQHLQRITAEAGELRGENNILRHELDTTRTQNQSLLHDNQRAADILNRLLTSRDAGDILRLQAETRALFGYDQPTDTSGPPSNQSNINLSEPSQTQQQKGLFGRWKRKHGGSSPKGPPTSLRRPIMGTAAVLPNDVNDPEIRKRSYVIIDCTSQARLHNSILNSTTFRRIEGTTREKPWGEVLGSIESCQLRVPSASGKYPAPKCLVHSVYQAGCNWSYDASEANIPCPSCSGSGDEKTWGKLAQGDHPQCLKTPAAYPKQLWLLNPMPGDMERQHEKDLENLNEPEPTPSPTTTRRGPHLRAGSGDVASLKSKMSNYFGEKIGLLPKSTSKSSLPAEQPMLRSRSSQATLRDRRLPGPVPTDMRVPSDHSHSSENRDVRIDPSTSRVIQAQAGPSTAPARQYAESFGTYAASSTASTHEQGSGPSFITQEPAFAASASEVSLQQQVPGGHYMYPEEPRHATRSRLLFQDESTRDQGKKSFR